MGFKISDQDSDQIAEINVVPLVDVMLVLLVVFMITAPLTISGIQVNLPQSKAKSQNVKESRIVLSIDKKGRYFLDKQHIPSNLLNGKLIAIFQHRNDKVLYIRADRTVSYAKVVDAMSAAKLSGVSKLSMLTQHKKK